MARTRTVTADELLDAAERVVVVHGAVGLSLDAVAKECGISKTRVVYDYKTKSALIEALVDRRFGMDSQKLEKAIASCADTQHPQLMGRLKHAQTAPDDVDKAVAVAITVSMSSNNNIQANVRQLVEKDFQDIENGERPRAALMAHFALMGFCFHEWLNLKKWDQKDRLQLLDDIAAIYTSFPDSAK